MESFSDNQVPKDSVSNGSDKKKRPPKSGKLSSKTSTTDQGILRGDASTMSRENEAFRAEKESKPRTRQRSSKEHQNDVTRGQEGVTKFKPLNFAPPSSSTTSTTQRKQKPVAPKSAPSVGENGALPKPRKVRTRTNKGATKNGLIEVASIPEDPTMVVQDQIEASVSKHSVSLPKFAASQDPFPTEDQVLANKTSAMALRDESDHLSTRPMEDTKGLSAYTKPVKTNRSIQEVRQSEKRSTRIRPDRRARSQKDQLPASMFVDQSVSRGPHGRFTFSALAESSAQLKNSPPGSPRNYSPHGQNGHSLEQRSVQREQYMSGPGLVAQKQRNIEADHEILQYQKRSSLNFAPPMNLSNTQNESGNPDATMSLPKKEVSASVTLKPAKKPYFVEHLTREVALKGLEDGKYLRGQLRISPKARNEAWVTVTSKNTQEDDILIEGEKHRNRALNGDEVVLEIIPKEAPATSDVSQVPMRKDASDEIEKHSGRTRGRVVCILQQRPLQRISGFIRPPGWVNGAKKQDERALIANESNKTSCTFQPQDQRIPWLTIGKYDLPKDLRGPNWIFNILQKQRTIYAARISTWQNYSRTPRGTIVDELGIVGNISTETAAILADCDVDVRDHPASALLCLPETPWSISEEEVSKRRDFRRDRVCTIDPETARDLDDALSVRRLDGGNYEIGVHIADVSHFIEQGNALDKIAQDRATTVYMVQKAIPMLPRLLCEELCSLNPAVDRLAFSVTWTMNEVGEEVGPRWYGRSVIRSAVRFAYGEAQNLLDGQSWAEGVGKAIDGGHTEEEITNDVKVLLKMSKAMRARRFENGALTINAFKLNFRLDQDGLPGVAEVYQLKDANRLIEEFMLKANISVAEKIVDAFPEHALLRKHPPPKDRPLKEFVNYAEKLGIHIDGSSSASLQDGFNRLGELAKDNPMVGVLQNNAVRSMRRAEYMCTGVHEDREMWGHYALAVPLYTHFTSPIRRYADVVVHRLLDRALKQGPAGFEAEECEEWAKNCNVRKENARTAQDRSSMLYLCAYIEATCRKTDRLGTDIGMEVEAIVIAVRDRSVDLIVPGMALEKRIYYDSSHGIASFAHDEATETTEIRWRSEAGRQAAIRRDENDDDNADGGARANVEGVEGEDEGAGPTTRVAVMDRIWIWVRGDFEVSPCQVNAGFVVPHPARSGPSVEAV